MNLPTSGLRRARLPHGSGPCQQRCRKDGCAKSCVPTTHAAPLIAPSLPSPAHPLGRPAAPSQPGLRKCFQTWFRAPGASLAPRRQLCEDGKTRPQPGSASVSGHRCQASGSVRQDPACSVRALPTALPQDHGTWGSGGPQSATLGCKCCQAPTHSCTVSSPERLKSQQKG